LELPLPLFFYAVLLIEIFASDQSDSEKMPLGKTVSRFALPADLPVLVEANSPNQACLKFADTEIASAERNSSAS
jgi:hypothetical protein